MNTWSNGTVKICSPGSYQSLLSGLEDLLKGKPKVFEVHHLHMKIVEEGKRIGIAFAQIGEDVHNIHVKGREES